MTMGSELRGICDVCHRSVRLTAEGFLMSHPFSNQPDAPTCTGSATPPAPAQPRLPGHQRGPLQHYAPPTETTPALPPDICTRCGGIGLQRETIDVQGNGRLAHVTYHNACGAGVAYLSRVRSQALKRVRAEQRKAIRVARRKAARAA